MDSHLLQKMVGQTFELTDESESNAPPESISPQPPGVFYDVEMGKGTFRLKGESGLWGEADKKKGGEFFSTSRLELAEVIVDQIFNRRFALDEEELCNISDPGGSWWIKRDERQVYIFLGGHYSDDKINLGPLGDGAVAYTLFKRGESWIRRLLPLEEFYLDQKCLALSALNVKNKIFEQFCDIFIEGVEATHPSFGTSALSLYLDELAVVRRFWIHLQENVVLKSSQDF